MIQGSSQNSGSSCTWQIRDEESDTILASGEAPSELEARMAMGMKHLELLGMLAPDAAVDGGYLCNGAGQHESMKQAFEALKAKDEQ